MDRFKTFTGKRLGQLKNVTIECSEGEQVGRLIDAVIQPTDDGAEISKFIVGGSFMEEFLESVKLRKDIDPVFDVDMVDEVSPSKIKLNVPKSDLKSTHIHQDAISDDEIKLSSLKNIKVYDEENVRIGRIIDLKFENNKFQFILGESKITEWAESIGLVADVDFLISPDFIKSIEKDRIILSKKKDDLKSTFFKSYDEWKNRSEQDQRKRQDEIRSHSVYFPNRF